jgi:sugar (pentulose or hexulose) kinase
MKYAIAVLDIGKTNKKLVIYNDNLKQIDSVYQSIPTIIYEDLEVEDTIEIEKWFYSKLKIMNSRYNIRSISISAHGATCACLGETGELSLPVVAYTNEVPDSFHREFYKLAGDPDFLQKETGTAQVRPLINLAKLIYFMKKRFPEEFDKTEKILMYPQYFAYRLTGKLSADYTYAGCHTYLWDFKHWQWSSVVEKLGIQSKIPTGLNNPGDILGTISEDTASKTGLREDTCVTVGVHDSNSSLIPYLLKGKENFILNSTGTWCVIMHPTETYSFSEEEIGKTVFYNISADQGLVKTAIFMGGLEFETYMKFMKKRNHPSDYPGFNKDLMERILNGNCDFIIPGIVRGAGQFPDSFPVVHESETQFPLHDIEQGKFPLFFDDYAYAYGVLNLSLAVQTKVSIDRIKAPLGSPIYIEGGFRNNPVYTSLIASMYPDSSVYTTNIKEATSLGAALLSKAAYEKVELSELKSNVPIEMTRVKSESLKNLNNYIARFMDKVSFKNL